MFTKQILDEVLTLSEAVRFAKELGCPLDRSDLIQYMLDGRLVARKTNGNWITTRSAVRDLIVSLEIHNKFIP